jgi:hypothetical protein
MDYVRSLTKTAAYDGKTEAVTLGSLTRPNKRIMTRSHCHTHAHSHAPVDYSRAFMVGVGLNTAFVVTEIVYGLSANSLASSRTPGAKCGVRSIRPRWLPRNNGGSEGQAARTTV